jgi:NAD(P)H-dependent FMN reductase
MTRLAIIVGSTRPGRRAELVAQWVHRVASGSQRAEFAIVDLADHTLPLLDEPTPAAMGTYVHDHTKRWAEVIASYDGYVFVCPEYNHSVPAALKNAIDYLYAEWGNKAAGLVTYGLQGGTRAAEHLRLILAELGVADVRTQVALSVRDDFLFNDRHQPNSLTPPLHQEAILRRLLDEVIDWSLALEKLRHDAGNADSDAGREVRA